MVEINYRLVMKGRQQGQRDAKLKPPCHPLLTDRNELGVIDKLWLFGSATDKERI